MTDLIRKDPKPLNRNRKPDLLRHGRTFHTAPDCRICSRCPGNRRSWKVSIAAWRGCSTTWWWSPCRPPCRLAQCSALQQSEWQHVSGRQASDSTIRGVRLSVEPHRRQLKTFTPIDTKIRVNYLYAHPLESAAAVWSFCSLTTEHKAHGEPKSSLHVRIHTSPWVKKKKAKNHTYDHRTTARRSRRYTGRWSRTPVPDPDSSRLRRWTAPLCTERHISRLFDTEMTRLAVKVAQFVGSDIIPCAHRCSQCELIRGWSLQIAMIVICMCLVCGLEGAGLCDRAYTGPWFVGRRSWLQY